MQRGHDPRDYTLVAFGGAGPLHAARLARELDISRILVPRNPGILCAMGLLLTDLRADFATTRLHDAGRRRRCRRWTEAFARLAARAGGLVRRARASAPTRAGAHPDGGHALCRAELRAADPAAGGPDDGTATLDALAEGFAAAHRRMYGFVAEGEAVQLVTFRIEAAGLVRKAAFQPQPDAGADASGAIIGQREVWLPEAGGFVACPVYDRERLRAGNRIAGPAIVEQMDTTTVVLPGMAGRVEPYLNLILEFA